MSANIHMSKNKMLLRQILFGLFLFVLFFGLLFLLRNRMHFNSDEYDNILGGMVVANGGEMYKDFVSQHTPMMYYLCAFVYLLGARTVIMFRLMMFAGLSLVWVIMYFRYKKSFGRLAMLIYPISYITLMFTSDTFSHCILSEQAQSQALVILLLEFLQYKRLKSLKLANYIFISLSVLFSFGTAFISIYPIFIIGTAVLIIEITEIVKAYKTDKNTGLKEIKPFFVSGVFLVAICMLPFAILFSVYAFKGNIENAIYGIYTVNRVYYPKYGGASTSILMSFFNPITVFKNTMSNTGMFYVNLAVGGTLAYALIEYNKRGLFRAIVCIGYIYMTAMRAMTGFHGLPFLAVGMCFFALTVQRGFVLLRNNKIFLMYSDIRKKIVSAILIVIVLNPFLLTFCYSFKSGEHKISAKEFSTKIIEGSAEDVIVTVTDKNEKIYDTTITLLYVATQRLPISAPGFVCPWIYEAYHDKIIESLDEEKPKLVYMPRSFEVWGYKADEFAADLYEKIREDYTDFSKVCGVGGIYIRNGYVDEAADRWKARKAVKSN